MQYVKSKLIENRARLLTVPEVAEILHVHTNTLRRWSDTGKISSLRINSRGDRRYRPQDIEGFLDSLNN